MPSRGKRIADILDFYREKNDAVPIVVEGIRDVSTLRKLEFSGRIIPLNNGKSLMNFSEGLSREFREVILLTDFDRKGVRLKKEISRYLESLGTSVDVKLWGALMGLMPIRSIEELPWAVEKSLEENRKIVNINLVSRRYRKVNKD
ncbi:MAG: toprim domain-containing protein [Candidatus Thermoplasmatota archaeon]|jgi:5S rRNA maturation endonuclease (ribonuclease M5)|nr:toprim domain-containing protein [Candidatus Thermoplasmatota archaeon]MCL5785618.1 toprim domain-containing protein [Candidatus Thermoplasmatota archaeon]